MNRSAIALLLSLAVPSWVVAQESPRISIEDALRLFAANNVDLQIARTRAAEAAGLAQQAGAFPNPSVTLTHEPLSGDGHSYWESYLNVSQRLEVGGQRGARKTAANLVGVAMRAYVYADSARLAFDVKRTFVEATAAGERLVVTRRVAEVFREAANSALRRQEEGDVSVFEMRRIRLESHRYETLLAEAVLDAVREERALALLLSPGGDATRITPAGLPAPLPPPLGETLLTAAIPTQRAELVAAQAKRDAALSEVRLARAERISDLTAVTGYKRQADGLRGFFLGLTIPLPVFDRNAGAIETADARVRAAEDRVVLTRRQIENDQLRAVEVYRSLRQRADALLGGSVEAVDLLEIARVAYDAGEMELVELLDAANALQEARTAEVRLRADLWIAYYDLERALGQLTAAPTGTTEGRR